MLCNIVLILFSTYRKTESLEQMSYSESPVAYTLLQLALSLSLFPYMCVEGVLFEYFIFDFLSHLKLNKKK